MRSPDMRALLRGSLLLVLPLLLSACGTRQPAKPNLPPVTPPLVVEQPPPAPPPSPASSIAEWAQRARAMPGNELLAETQKLLELGDPRAKLNAAIALAQPQHPARDEGRAVALAEEVARSGEAKAPLRDMAAVVALWLDEQRRADADRRRAQTKTREDEARLQMIETRLRDMERRAQEAEKKLEALRAIERDLSGRGAGNGRP